MERSLRASPPLSRVSCSTACSTDWRSIRIQAPPSLQSELAVSLSVHGYILWDRELVTASIIIGTIFAAAALETTFRLKKRIGIHAGWVLLTLAICSLHFTGMAAITISAGPDMDLPGQRIS